MSSRLWSPSKSGLTADFSASGGVAASPTWTDLPGLNLVLDNDVNTMFKDAGVTPASVGGVDTVQQWNAKYGTTRNFSQPTAANRPTFNIDGTGPYLAFDGVNDSIASATGLSWNDGVGKQWMAVTAWINNTTGNQYLMHQLGTQIVASISQSAGTPNAFSYNSVGSGTNDPGLAVSAGVWVTFIAEMTDTFVEMFVNNSSAGSTALSGTRQTNVANLILGSNNGAGLLNGRIRRASQGAGPLGATSRALLQSLMSA